MTPRFSFSSGTTAPRVWGHLDSSFQTSVQLARDGLDVSNDSDEWCAGELNYAPFRLNKLICDLESLGDGDRQGSSKAEAYFKRQQPSRGDTAGDSLFLLKNAWDSMVR